MKMFLLSDNIDTEIGLRLSGIQGKVIHSKAEVLESLEKLVADDEIGVVIITALLADLVKEKISEVMMSKSKPAILIIPDRHGKISDGGFNIMTTTLGMK